MCKIATREVARSIVEAAEARSDSSMGNTRDGKGLAHACGFHDWRFKGLGAGGCHGGGPAGSAALFLHGAGRRCAAAAQGGGDQCGLGLACGASKSAASWALRVVRDDAVPAGVPACVLHAQCLVPQWGRARKGAPGPHGQPRWPASWVTCTKGPPAGPAAPHGRARPKLPPGAWTVADSEWGHWHGTSLWRR
jgi:hypothetical protein